MQRLKKDLKTFQDISSFTDVSKTLSGNCAMPNHETAQIIERKMHKDSRWKKLIRVVRVYEPFLQIIIKNSQK